MELERQSERVQFSRVFHVLQGFFDDSKSNDRKKPPKSKIAQGGKGKKQCPNCGNFVSGRAKECACGHTFEFKSASAATKRGRKSISGLEAVQAEISQIEAELSGIEEKKSRLETLKKAAELLAS